MACQLSNNNPPAVDDQTAVLNKCIYIFRSAKTDNERFAALLLVTRVVRSNDIDNSQRKLLYHAIGFTFINRLLKTKGEPENYLYQSLAVAILACFATDEDLLFHPQMAAKVEFFNRIISNPPDDESMVDDAYQILKHFSLTADGCKVLSQKGTVLCLCNAIMSGSFNKAAMAWQILLNTTSLANTDIWHANSKPLIELVVHCAERLKTLQDSLKFTYCANLLSLLTFTDKNAFRNALGYLDHSKRLFLLSDLATGLGDILQGKVTSLQRDPALILVSFLVNLLDEEGKWDFLTNCNPAMPRADFFVLVATLVSIEIRMILDESTKEEMLQKATLLSSCYNILEAVISLLITMTDDEVQEAQAYKPSQQGVTKIYSLITEAMMSVLGFLQRESIGCEEKSITSKEENALVLASSRVLLAWLAEESMALQEEVCKVIPFLMKISRDTLPTNSNSKDNEQTSANSSCIDQNSHEKEGKNVEFIQLMLPGLCHLSSEDKSRKILIENATIDCLKSYYLVLWHRFEQGSLNDSKTALITLLGVFLNFVVTEEHLVKNDNSFKEILVHITANSSKIDHSSENFLLLANMVVLGLMLIRLHKTIAEISVLNCVESFFTSVVFFLKKGVSLSKGEDDKLKWSWSSVSELLFLGIQVLTKVLKDSGDLVLRGVSEDVLSQLVTLSTAAIQSQQPDQIHD